MKGSRIIISVLLLAAALGSCKNDLVSLEENIIEKAKDKTAPGIFIVSPIAETQFGQAVTISGNISDDGQALPTLKYQVVNDLGEIKNQGNVDITQVDGSSGVAGTFSFRFSTEGLNSDILVNLTATDWNGNTLTVDPLRLLYTGSALPSFTGESGNNQITLNWDKIEGIDDYTVYYTVDARIFNKVSARTITESSHNSEDLMTVSLTRDENDLQNGRLVQVQVSASMGEELFSSPVIDLCPLSPLTLLPRLEEGNDSIKVYWNAIQAADGKIPEYSVWRSDSGEEDSYSLVSPANWTKNNFTDDSVHQGQRYYYRVSCDMYSEVMSQSAEGEIIPFDFNPNTTQLIEGLESGSYYIADSAFTPDGSRLFLLDTITNSLIEVDIDTGEMIGTPLTWGDDGNIYKLAASNERIYVLRRASSLSSLVSVEISTPGILTRKSNEDIILPTDSADTLYTSFVYDNNKLYIGDYKNKKHYSVDINNPETLVELGSDTIFDSIRNIAYVGDVLYSLGSYKDGAVTKYGISYFSNDTWKHRNYREDSDNPDDTFSYMNFAIGKASKKLVLLCDTSYYSDSDVLVWVYDIQTDGSLLIADFKRLEDRAFNYYNNKGKVNIAIIGPTAYGVRSNGSVQAINIGSKVYEQDVIETRVSHHLSAYEDTRLLSISMKSSGIGIASVPEPSIMTIKNTIGTVGTQSGGQFVYKNRMIYSQEQSTFKQYKVEDNKTLSLNYIKNYPSDANRGGIVVHETLLYQGRDSELNIFPLNESGEIGEAASSIPIRSKLIALNTSGDYLFASEVDGIEIFDISDSENIHFISFIRSEISIEGVQIWQNYLFIQDNGYGLCCYDISKPEDPILISIFYDRTSSGRGANDLDIFNGNLYLGSATGLYVLPLETVDSWSPADTNSGRLGSAVYWIDKPITMVKTAGNLLFCTSNGFTEVFSLENPKKPSRVFISPESYSFKKAVILGNDFYGRGINLLHMHLQD